MQSPRCGAGLIDENHMIPTNHVCGGVGNQSSDPRIIGKAGEHRLAIQCAGAAVQRTDILYHLFHQLKDLIPHPFVKGTNGPGENCP